MASSSEQAEEYTVELNEKPCAVKFLKEWSRFLVGTYILLPTVEDAKDKFPNLGPEALAQEQERINHRVGSLILLGKDEGDTKFSIKDRMACLEGGVFDFSVLDGIIYVAHANNTIGLYEFTNAQKLTHKKTIELNETSTQNSATLLTSIDTCRLKVPSGAVDHTTFVVVGDSQGFITIVDVSDPCNSCKIIARSDVTTTKDPVWTAKFMPARAEPIEDCLMLVVACEDCCWYIYHFEYALPGRNLVQLFKRQDHTAGVTSICFGPWVAPEQTTVMLGSYNEHIELYTINTHSRRGIRPMHLDSVRIDGGGIWRMTLVQDTLYVAAMYAGSHKCRLGHWSLTRFTKLFETLKQSGKYKAKDDEDGEASLHYDIDVSLKHNTICAVDFNKSLCILSNQL